MRAAFLLWIACVAMGGAALMTRHHRTLRASAEKAAPGAAIGPTRLIHVLVPGCACSARIARDLRGVPGEIRWVDPAEAQQMRKAHGVPGGPWLLAFDRDGRLFYSGGYGRDVDPGMLARLAAGQPEAARRSYGCAFPAAGDAGEAKGFL